MRMKTSHFHMYYLSQLLYTVLLLLLYCVILKQYNVKRIYNRVLINFMHMNKLMHRPQGVRGSNIKLSHSQRSH